VLQQLTPDNAYIWRIVHKSNLPTVFQRGCVSRSLAPLGTPYVEIGNPELILKRTARHIPIAPFGTLADFVPFYFTPFSPMLYNIKTGFQGVPKKSMEDIVILASSLHDVAAAGIQFVFTDRHAYLQTARFSSDIKDLSMVDWASLQQRNFKKDDPERFEKYQAEALVYKSVPFSIFKGIACYNEEVVSQVKQIANEEGLELNVIARPSWFL
jgi:ssDNA thymidine ADP-ribosyltransferase, DarT